MAPLQRASTIFRPALRVTPRGLTPLQAALTVGASGLAGAFAAHSGDWRSAFGLIALGALATFGFLAPAAFVGLFLLVRPLLDDAPVGSHAPGAAPLLLVALLVMALPATRRRVVTPSGTTAFVGVLLVSMVVALEAVMNFSGQLDSRAIGEVARIVSLLAAYLLAATLL